MNVELRQQNNFAVFSGLLGACLWLAIAAVVFLVRREDVLAPFEDFENYHTTSGEIIHSTTIYKSGLGGSYHFDIKYKYAVAGTEFIASKVHFISTGNAYGDYAKSYEEKYPVGKSVTVYFDPGNPSDSVLEPENRTFSYLALIATYIFMSLVFTTISIWLLLRKQNSDRLPSG